MGIPYAYLMTAEKEVNASHRQAISSNNLRLELFLKAVTATINVLLHAVYESLIEITQLLDVITHYAR